LRNQKTATEVGSFINFGSQKIKFIYHLHHSCGVIENPTTNTRNICLLSLDTQRSLTTGNIALKKELTHLETSVREVELAAQINLGLIRFL